MCGRYTQALDLKTLQKRFGFTAGKIAIKPRFNIAPTQEAPVVIHQDGHRLELFRWGLIPSWAKDPDISHHLINARAESLLDKPAFKRPFQRTRCLVLCDGFYEWRHDPAKKARVPMRVVLKSKEPFAMAGLWDSWTDSEGRTVRSFAIITVESNELLRPIHDRMPAILQRAEEEEWLDDRGDVGRLSGLLSPYPAAELSLYEVPSLVNSPDHDEPACIAPAKR